MDKSWLDRYPKAAAMLQGDDDVLLYEPQSCRGLEDPLDAAQVLMGAAVDAMSRRIDAEMVAAYERAGGWLPRPDVVEIWQPDREVRLESDDVEEFDRGDW